MAKNNPSAIISFPMQVLDFFFPGTCMSCGIVLTASRPPVTASPLHHHVGKCFCNRCAKRIRQIPFPRCGCQETLHSEEFGKKVSTCSFCEKIHNKPDTILPVFRFGGPISDAIHQLKYKRQQMLAHWFVELVLMHCQNEIKSVLKSNQITQIVSVPITRRRKFGRGFNQSELLANGFSQRLGVPASHHKLIRIRHTAPQARMKETKDRAANIQRAFGLLKPRCFEGEKILLIDDVMTTGSTVSVCADVLRTGGATHVSALTLATAADHISSQYLF